MTQKFRHVFGAGKPVIGMVHFGVLPGSPLFDADSGLDGLIEGTCKDIDALQKAGFDAIMFGNENDRPSEQMGRPLELFDRPANTFVAGFIGSPAMNMLKGKVESSGVRVDGAVLPASGGQQVSEGQEVLYGVRPEHFEISDNGLPARISVVEPTGSETTVVLRFGESEIVALFRERHDFKPGDTLHLRPRRDLVHLFDPRTGQRV